MEPAGLWQRRPRPGDRRGRGHHLRRAARLALHGRPLLERCLGGGLMRRRITEYLEVDLERELWCCRHCGHKLGSARENYKRFCLVDERDPREVHNPYTMGAKYDYTLAPDPEWCRIVEFYCPSCATLV